MKKDGKDVDSSEDDETTALLPQKILKKKEAKLEIYDLWGDSGINLYGMGILWVTMKGHKYANNFFD